MFISCLLFAPQVGTRTKFIKCKQVQHVGFFFSFFFKEEEPKRNGSQLCSSVWEAALATLKDTESGNKSKLHKTEDGFRCMSTKWQQMLKAFCCLKRWKKEKLARLLSALPHALLFGLMRSSPSFFFFFRRTCSCDSPIQLWSRRKRRMTLIIMGGEAFSVLPTRLTGAVSHAASGRWVHAKVPGQRRRRSSPPVVRLSYG